MSEGAKRNLLGAAAVAALATLFLAFTLWPIWSQGAGGPAREIVLEARDLAFGGDNPTLVLRPGERVRLVVRNTDPGVRHSIQLPGIDDRVYDVRWGEEVALEFTVPEAGRFRYVCPQHAPRMEGTIVVDSSRPVASSNEEPKER